MTKDEAKELLLQLGVKVEKITDEALAKVEAGKAQLDTETRRKVRAFWLIVCCVVGAGMFLLGMQF